MVSDNKRQYMCRYNQLAETKLKKAAYMRKKRAEQDQVSARSLVRFLLDAGYEDMAFEYAQERAPEMLATVAAQPRKKSATA